MNQVKILTTLVIITACITHNRYAKAACQQISCPSSVNATYSGANCKTTESAVCYKQEGSGTVFKFVDCATCSSGTRQLVTANNACRVSFYTCPCNETNWTATSGNQEKRTTCNCQSNYPCPATNSNRCKYGYYPKQYPNCESCPAYGNYAIGSTQEIIKGTEYFGANQISQCYLRSNQAHSDATGNFTYISNCGYKQ